MLGWNNDELMIESYLDMRIACKEETMQQLKNDGWRILNMCRIDGERRYTMVLPERSDKGYVFTEVKPLYRRDRPVLRRVS